jgi:glycosyltransferase involved in cell wall biosynthesis
VRILFFSHYFPPEVNAPANRTFEHCREWARAGHEVHVVTCVPSHPRGVPFPGYRRRSHRREERDGIVVHRVWTYLAANQGVVKRTLNYVSFVPSAAWRALRLGRFDVIAATSPQFFCAVAGWVAARLKRTPWVFELRDLWPESVAAVGALRRSVVLRLVERLELHLYRSAARVVCLTRSFMANLERRNIPAEKLVFVPNGVDLDFWGRGSPVDARQELGVAPDEVLVTYIGTVGMAHGIGTVLEAARTLASTHRHVRLAVIGDGAELGRLQEEHGRGGLGNVVFTGLVPHDKARDIMAASDVALVLLKRSELFLTVLPSKMFEAMGAGRAIVLGVAGEAREALERAGAGIAVTPESAVELADAIGTLADDAGLRHRLGEAGRRFAVAECDRRVLAQRMLDVIEGVARGDAVRGANGDALPSLPGHGAEAERRPHSGVVRDR